MRYFLIINDATDPFGYTEGLFTKEFYGNCYNALRDDGIMVNQQGSPFYAEDATAMQCALDCTVFAQCIAPPLRIRTRFVGQEPLDPVTAQYNAAMAALLPRHGVQVREIPRLEVDGQPVSASRVRRLLKEKGLCPEVLSLVPPTTAAYLQESFAQE